MMYHALRGLGATVCDDTGAVCWDDGISPPPLTNNAGNASIQQGLTTMPGADYTDSVTGQRINGATGQPYSGQPTSGSPSAGFNWGIFAPLINAAGAIGGGFAAGQLKPGQSLQTAGTTITGAGLALPGSVAGGLNLSSLTMPLLIGGGLLIVVMMMSGGKR